MELLRQGRGRRRFEPAALQFLFREAPQEAERIEEAGAVLREMIPVVALLKSLNCLGGEAPQG